MTCRRPLLFALVGAVLCALYSFFAPPVYESVASVVLARDRIENPNAVSEDAKNRWVWVRDGLTLTESLLSDDLLTEMMQSNDLASRYEGLPERLRKELRIDYTGGDSNTFIFKARDRSPDVAQNLARAMVARLEQAWVTERRDRYAEALKAIAAETPKTESESSLTSRAYLRNVYNGLLVASRFSDVMAQKNFQVVRKPSLPRKPLWPRPFLIVPLGAVVGLVLATALALRKTA